MPRTACLFSVLLFATLAEAQALGVADTGGPGDAAIQGWLARQAEAVQAGVANDLNALVDWKRERPRRYREYLYMLGLDPLPEKTPLEVTVTGQFRHRDVIVEKLHFQSRPKLYVTANLYRPAIVNANEKLPAIVYVCGHSNMGRNGNKSAYQANGVWFASHGYVCLVLDTLQLGEIGAFHHGTYREGRWWWHARGYTPAGVECWNGVRAVDYLVGRPDVDSKRIGVTGRSGGGAASFWIAGADDRIAAAAPVSGMADLLSYIPNRTINGHCDCMFLYNTYRWPWLRIAGLPAPRPLLFVNGDTDGIFPMDANERISNGLERLYGMHFAGDRFETLVSIGGHSDRPDIRQGVFRFFNSYFKGDSRYVTDTELGWKSENGKEVPEIPPERLRVFPNDSDLPKDELNTRIDEHFVPLGKPAAPTPGNFAEWKAALMGKLREYSFRPLPTTIPSAIRSGVRSRGSIVTDVGIHATLAEVKRSPAAEKPVPVCMAIGEAAPKALRFAGSVHLLQPRGVGPHRWTTKNPPNYVERSHVLVGWTADLGRLYDIVAAAKLLRAENDDAPLTLAGEGPNAILAAYAALLIDDAVAVEMFDPPISHMHAAAPQFLNILRIGDVPDFLGLLAPRKLTIHGAESLKQAVAKSYAAGGVNLPE